LTEVNERTNNMYRIVRSYLCVLSFVFTGFLMARQPPPQTRVWHWQGYRPEIVRETYGSGKGSNLLTRNNGEHALSVTEYPASDQTVKAWCTIMSQRASSGLFAYEYKNWTEKGH